MGNNKARAWESLGFAHKKRLCQHFDTTSYNKVKAKPFKDDQLDLLEAGIGNRGLSCKQCVRMMSIYRFDDDKLEVLKILAPNISDRENYDEIINALDFISSEEKARSILGIKK